VVVVRDFRNESACALPRPSAIASAKFAKTTVNHSQSASWSVKPQSGFPAPMSRKNTTVVYAEPSSTTNITGFLSMCRGFSFTNASRSARLTIGGSKSGRLRSACCRWAASWAAGRAGAGAGGRVGIVGVAMTSAVARCLARSFGWALRKA